jgi:hypothetical protein
MHVVCLIKCCTFFNADASNPKHSEMIKVNVIKQFTNQSRIMEGHRIHYRVTSSVCCYENFGN